MMFEKTSSTQHIELTVQLAEEIWTQHYTPILAPGQVQYMLDKFQSVSAIKEQIENGHQYYLIFEKTIERPGGLEEYKTPLGYFDFYRNEDFIFVSKIYVKNEFRGRGYGQAALAFISERAKDLDAKKLQLTVNKYNQSAIKAYEKMGFINVKSLVIDIGSSFAMDDFVLEKKL